MFNMREYTLNPRETYYTCSEKRKNNHEMEEVLETGHEKDCDGSRSYEARASPSSVKRLTRRILSQPAENGLSLPE